MKKKEIHSIIRHSIIFDLACYRKRPTSDLSRKIKTTSAGLINTAAQPTNTLLEEMQVLKEFQDQSEAKKSINSELWHACAGPLVSLPQTGNLVLYFPQGHNEQVAVSTKRAATSQIPNYPGLPSQLTCQVHNVTLHCDKEPDEIFAQMTLQPVNSDYSMQPPTQELIVHDLHDNSWTFRHIYRGQPKRHLLTTGWSVFVGSKILKAGDAVLFIRDERSQLMVGVRRANHQQTNLPSSVLSADSMHFGILAAAAHAAANRSPFTIFYNPRACPSEFVIPLTRFQKAIYGTQVSVGMRFGMMLEIKESGKRRYMGTVIGISDLDHLRWPNSKWRNLQLEWDEAGCGEKQNRVSLWDIETPESLFVFPSLTSNLKRPVHTGFGENDWGNLFKRPFARGHENGTGAFSYSSFPSLLKPPVAGPIGAMSVGYLPPCVTRGTPLLVGESSVKPFASQKSQFLSIDGTSLQNHNSCQNILDVPQILKSNLLPQTHASENTNPPFKGESQSSPKPQPL